MTLYDSSVLIDYLAGDEDATSYIESNLDERAVAPPMVLFEVYQGEVFRRAPADFAAVDAALSWLSIAPETAEFARSAAELQNVLLEAGTPLAARDAHIAGTALGLDERLAVADSDFDVPRLAEAISIDFV